MTAPPTSASSPVRMIFVPSMRVESDNSRAIVIRFSSRTPMTVRSLSRLPVSTVTVFSVISSSAEIERGTGERFARDPPASPGLFRK